MTKESVPSAQQDELMLSAGSSLSPEPVGITIRSILVGAILCVILSLVVPYNVTNIMGSSLAFDHNAPGAIALFFIFVAGVNLLLRIVARAGGDSSLVRKLPFSSSELLTIYVMLVVSSSLCTMGLGVQLPPIIAAPYYYNAGGETYAKVLAQFGAKLPAWLVVSDPEAARTFFSGLGSQEDFWPRFLAVFCNHWLKPLAYWALFLFAVYGAMVCLMVIIRKQWMEREILVYPLTRVPLAMVETDPKGGLVNPLFRNKLFWVGFAVPALVSTLAALGNYVPGFTPLNLNQGAPFWRTNFLEGLLQLNFRLSFAVVAFAFLINLDVSFSIWSFGLLGIIVMAGLQFFGVRFAEYLGAGVYGSQDNALLYHVGEGALLMMVAYGLWIARGHLRDVLAKALGRAPEVDDSKEILSYRSAVFGLFLCTVVMLVWLCSSGMSLWLAAAFLMLAFALFYALSRVVAEAGMATVVAPSIAATSIVSTFGASSLGPAGLISLGLSYIWAADLRTFVMAPVANGLRAVEGIKKGKRRLVWAIFLAIAITFVFSLSLVIYQAYHTGAINMGRWFFMNAPQVPYELVHRILQDQPGPNTTGWFLGGFGAAIMMALLLLRRRYLWWPLHPIGLIVMGTWIMSQIWFSFFLAWLIKAILIRYGGPRLYTKAVPLFLGLIIGQFVIAGVWVAIDFFTGTTGNALFWL